MSHSSQLPQSSVLCIGLIMISDPLVLDKNEVVLRVKLF